MAVHLNYEGMGEFLRSPEMQAAMRTIAEGFMERAVATAPVRTGRYKASFRVEVGVQHHKTSRAYARVVNDSPEAFYIEFGTKDTPRFRTLGKAFGSAV